MVIRKERKYWLKIHGADFAVPPKKKKNDRNVMVHYFGRICFGGMLRIMNSLLSTSHFLEWKRQESRKNNRKRAGKGKDAFNILRCFNWKADRSWRRRRTPFAPKCQRIVVYKTDLQLLRMLMKPGLLWPERDNGTSASELEKNQANVFNRVFLGSQEVPGWWMLAGPMPNFSAGCW